MTASPWLEDFNDNPPLPEPPQAEPELPSSPDPEPDVRLEGWLEGFVAGQRQAALAQGRERAALITELLHRIAALEAALERVAAVSSAQMGELLVDMLANALPADWPEAVHERMALVIEAVKPSFWLDPKFHLHLAHPAQIGLHDLPALVNALATLEETEWPVTIHWDTRHVPETALAALSDALRRPVMAAAELEGVAESGTVDGNHNQTVQETAK